MATILTKEQTKDSIAWAFTIGAMLKKLTILSSITCNTDGKTGECIFTWQGRDFVVTVQEIIE